MTNWKPSDAEVDAAWLELWTADTRYQTREWQNERVAAALIAARDAAPEPDTTEFEAAVDALIADANALGVALARRQSEPYIEKLRKFREESRQHMIAMYKERR